MFCPGNQSRLKIGKLARFRKYDLLIFDFTKIIYLFREMSFYENRTILYTTPAINYFALFPHSQY